MLDRRAIDWGRNPAVTRDNIEHNFAVLFSAYDSLLHGKMDSLQIDVANAGRILSASTDLSDLFAAKTDHTTVVIPGENIVTAGTINSPMISVSREPSFQRIFSGKSDLSDIFISRKDVSETVRPELGRNLSYAKGRNGLVLEVKESPHFEQMTVDNMSAITVQFGNIIYKGRPLEELLPSYQLPENAPYLTLRPLDWGKNADATRHDLNYNFDSISRAFNSLLQYKIDDVEVNVIRASAIMSGGTSLSDLFLPKDANYDVVRVQTGRNISTGGTQNRPEIHVVDNPSFKSLTAKTASLEEMILDGKNVLDVFYTRKEAKSLSHPAIGHNLRLSNEKSGPVIHVERDAVFDSITAISATADTLSFNSALFKGRPLESWFGSHTFIACGKNMVSAGTPHYPTLSITDHPSFVSVQSATATIDAVTAVTMVGNKALFDRLSVDGNFNVSNTIVVDGFDVSLANNLHVDNERITIGGEPESEVSSFLRTKVRILATQSSPIHYALIIQKKEHEAKRMLNDSTVDFAVRGDGNVGIGAFVDMTSKLTIKSENGFDQLRLVNPFSPSGSVDKKGEVGNITWDDDHLYVKTSLGWKRVRLDSF